MRVDDLNCISNNYLTVLQCSYSLYMDGVCTYGNSYDATVYCCKINVKCVVKHCYSFLQIQLKFGINFCLIPQYVFKVVTILVKDQLRYTVMDDGDLCVKMDLVQLMLTLFASSLVTLDQ